MVVRTQKWNYSLQKKKTPIVEVRTLYDLDSLHHPGVLYQQRLNN
jgi:hypothetical protein